MSSRYSANGQDPLNASSPVRATRVWNPFVPLRATSKPLSGFKTYTVALSLRRGGSALRASWISRSRGSGSILFLGALLHPLVDLLPPAGHALAVVVDDQSEPSVMELDQRAVFFLAQPVLHVV